jgi:hypothetical protein
MSPKFGEPLYLNGIDKEEVFKRQNLGSANIIDENKPLNDLFASPMGKQSSFFGLNSTS